MTNGRVNESELTCTVCPSNINYFPKYFNNFDDTNTRIRGRPFQGERLPAYRFFFTTENATQLNQKISMQRKFQITIIYRFNHTTWKRSLRCKLFVPQEFKTELLKIVEKHSIKYVGHGN